MASAVPTADRREGSCLTCRSNRTNENNHTIGRRGEKTEPGTSLTASNQYRQVDFQPHSSSLNPSRGGKRHNIVENQYFHSKLMLPSMHHGSKTALPRKECENRAQNQLNGVKSISTGRFSPPQLPSGPPPGPKASKNNQT